MLAGLQMNEMLNNTINILKEKNFTIKPAPLDTLPQDIESALPLFIINEYGIIGGLCSAIALILACHQIIMHLYFFNEPKLQLFIVRILLMVPVRNF